MRYIVNHAGVHIICIFTVQALFKIISLKIIKDMLSLRDLGNLDYDNVKGKKILSSLVLALPEHFSLSKKFDKNLHN
jgi:hypothetical protein